MYQIRRAAERGHGAHGWLDTWHTFSFADYYDPQHRRFRALRVINEDWVAPGQGFGTHPHNDMEIVTYVLSGALEHRDSMGNGEILRPGEFQRMSAGTGITHSEFNPSTTEPVHLYQIWLFPESKGITPSYEQASFPVSGRFNEFRRVASQTGAEGSLTIHTDASVYLAEFTAGGSATYVVPADRHVWLQVLRGTVVYRGEHLEAGDGLALSDELQLQLEAKEPSEVMLFDLA